MTGLLGADQHTSILMYVRSCVIQVGIDSFASQKLHYWLVVKGVVAERERQGVQDALQEHDPQRHRLPR